MAPGELPSNNLPNANPNFTGREKQLEQIRAGLESGERLALTQSITGLGGVGKTQIALAYAYKYSHTYPAAICWVDASANESILAAYRDFALRRDLIAEDTKPDIVIEATRNWMAQHEGWLFIFDNADEDGGYLPHQVLENYLPQSQQGRRHILITSRYTFWQGLADQIEVKVFTLKEAKDFLRQVTGRDDDERQLDLAEALGYLPLALAQAAAYIAEEKIGYAEYLRQFEERRLAIFGEETESALTPKDTVLLTWEISFAKIKNEGARQLLNCCAFLAPDDIDLGWLKQGRAHLPKPLQDDVADEPRRKRIVKELRRYSLVTKNENGAISLHRLVQEVVREGLGDERGQWRDYCLAALDECRFLDFSTAEKRQAFTQLAPHIESVCGDGETAKQRTLVNLCFFLGYGFNQLSDYATALDWYGKALAIREKVLGPEHADTATCYNNIALVYHAQSNYPKALEFYEKALAIVKKVLGEEHPNTAATYSNIGEVYRAQGDYPKALESLQKALIKTNPNLAATYSSIGEVYRDLFDYPKALKSHENALAIREKFLGQEHPETAESYNNIGLVHKNQGNYGKALESYDKALAIWENVLGKEHPHTATIYNNIGQVYGDQHDYAKALNFYDKALKIHEKMLGKEHPSTATIYNNIASVYGAKGDYAKALEFFQKALEIDEKVLGKEHLGTAIDYGNIAGVYLAKGDYDKGLEECLKAYKIFLARLGKEDQSTQTVKGNMESVYGKTGNPQPFEEWLRAAL